MKRLVAEVDDEIHDTWHKFAKAHGCTPTTFIEQLAVKYLADYTEPGSHIDATVIRRCAELAKRQTKRNRSRKGN